MEHHWGSEALRPFDRDLPSLKLRYILPAVQAPNIRVLEVGCGNGKILRSVRNVNPSCELHGCDVREPAAARDFSFTKITGPAFPYGDALFDAVIVMDVLEHVRPYRRYLAEIRRILKPGGYFAGFVPVEGNPLSAYAVSRLLFGRDVMERTKEHVNSFTTGGLVRLLAEHFTVERLRYSYHAVGQTMDCLLFTLMLNKTLERLFWNKNRYYNTEAESASGLVARCFNAALTAANRIAYYESALLKNVRAGAAGIHFICTNSRAA